MLHFIKENKSKTNGAAECEWVVLTNKRGV